MGAFSVGGRAPSCAPRVARGSSAPPLLAPPSPSETLLRESVHGRAQRPQTGAEARASRGPASQVLAGVTSHGAAMQAPGVVRHAGAGPTLLAPYAVPGGGGGDAAAAALLGEAACERAAALLQSAGFEAQALSGAQLESATWRKLAVNAAINPLTARFWSPACQDEHDTWIAESLYSTRFLHIRKRAE